MPLVADDLIQPEGLLEPDMFDSEDPAGDTEARVTAWIVEAELKVVGFPADVRDEAASNWVYYRAYDSLANKLASSPLSSGIPAGQLTETWSVGQIADLRAKAAAFLSLYQGYEVEEVESVSNTSTHAELRAVW